MQPNQYTTDATSTAVSAASAANANDSIIHGATDAEPDGFLRTKYISINVPLLLCNQQNKFVGATNFNKVIKFIR